MIREIPSVSDGSHEFASDINGASAHSCRYSSDAFDILSQRPDHDEISRFPMLRHNRQNLHGKRQNFAVLHDGEGIPLHPRLHEGCGEIGRVRPECISRNRSGNMPRPE